jgi:hypothetical protein
VKNVSPLSIAASTSLSSQYLSTAEADEPVPTAICVHDHSGAWEVLELCKLFDTEPYHISRFMFFSTAVVLSVLAFRTGRQTIVVIIKCYLLTAISAAIVAFSRFFAALGNEDVVSSIGRSMDNGITSETLPL